MAYSVSFLDALGRWQKGWRQSPVLRGPIAEALIQEVALLPAHVREHDRTPLYRKRNLYRNLDQKELAPLFIEGVLDEGSPTSWSTNERFTESFGRVFDEDDPNSAAGAIFRHVPTNSEVVLNIPRLWNDPEFVKAAEAYRTNGSETQAIFHFRGERDQFEVILHAPLRLADIFKLGRATTYGSLYETTGATSDETKAALDALFDISGIDPFNAKYLSEAATCRVVTRMLQKRAI